MAAWSSWGAWLSPRQMFERASKVPAPDLVLFLKNVLLADEPIFASLGLPDRCVALLSPSPPLSHA